MKTFGLLFVIAGCVLPYAFGLPPAVDPTGQQYIRMEQDDST